MPIKSPQSPSRLHKLDGTNWPPGETYKFGTVKLVL